MSGSVREGEFVCGVLMSDELSRVFGCELMVFCDWVITVRSTVTGDSYI